MTDQLQLFTSLYCVVLASQILFHYREQLRFFRTQPARLYGRQPAILGVIPTPVPTLRTFSVSGLILIASLLAVACGWTSRVGIALALTSSLLYFPPVLGLSYIRRKVNLIPITLAILLIARGPFALSLIRLALAMVYFSAGFEKLRASGFRWANGRSLQACLIRAWLCYDRGIALTISRNLRLCGFLSAAVLGWELTFWIILFIPQLSIFYALTGLLFHLGTSILMRIQYFIYFCPIYFVFLVPWLSTRL